MARADCETFQPGLFGMENFDSGGHLVTSLAAIFDLEGFTDFSSQSDPHLCVPGFVDRFITWLFEMIRRFSVEAEDGEGVTLFAPLPFFAKFLGDGVLFLWEIDYKGIEEFCRTMGRDRRVEVHGDVGNIISVLYDVCRTYTLKLCPELANSYSRVPHRLRCGVAQGLVCSLGNGADYVGPCINMAARLQKLGSLGLCILQRGIDLQLSPAERLTEILIRKRTVVRGSGEELIYVVKEEFSKLGDPERAALQDP